MNADYERQLEREIERELKALPELQAPHDLVSRVMQRVQKNAVLPWYRLPWVQWPPVLRAVCLVVLLVGFGGLCFGSWKLAQTDVVVAGWQRLANSLSTVSTLFHGINAVVSALLLVVKKLGNGVVLGCLAALAVGYGLCLALGSVYLRVGLSRR